MEMISVHRRMGRPVAVATAGAAVIALAGVGIAGAAYGPAVPLTRHISTSLASTCWFPSGAYRVGVRVAARFPVTATAGQAIQPAGVHVTITVPQAARRDLGRLRAAAVRATASLSVTVAEGRTSASADWRGLVARSIPLRTTGNLVLTAAGRVPSATAGPGRVTFRAGGTLLVFSLRTADAAASPATLAVPCSPRPGQDARLAVVKVLGPAPFPTGLRVPGISRHRSITVGQLHPWAGSRPSSKCFLRSKLPGIGSAFVAGYSDVRKLHGAALLGPGPNDNPRAGLTDIKNVEVVTDTCAKPVPIVYQYAIGELNYKGKRQFPPATATFLNFKFVPVTTTLTVSLVSSDCRDIGGKLIAKTGLCIVVKQPINTTQYVTTITSEENISVAGLVVNGVPLGVGPDCRTAVPTKVTLVGQSLTYSLLTGGPVTGYITIPQFTGCGVGEKINPLLNASVSGPRNFAILTQGPLCEKFPKHPANANCAISPGKPGYPFGFPKFYPKPVRHV